MSIALQWDRARWIWLLGMVAVGAILLSLGDNGFTSLRYDRDAVAAGQWWRVLTAHAIHLNLHHFILNSLGLVLVWALFASEYSAFEWLLIVVIGAGSIGIALWLRDPQVHWYVGASGVLHSAMGAGCVKRWVGKCWDRWILSICLVIKLVMEQATRARGGVGISDGIPVVVDAHLFGALAGALVGAALCARMAIIARYRITRQRH